MPKAKRYTEKRFVMLTPAQARQLERLSQHHEVSMPELIPTACRRNPTANRGCTMRGAAAMMYEGRYGKQRRGLLYLRKVTECRLSEVGEKRDGGLISALAQSQLVDVVLKGTGGL